MIQEITIENYKSIQSLTLELGRVTVFIGENGCGKSNILEAIALGSAAAANKLDNEFLASRGIRVTDPKLMRSGFDASGIVEKIRVFFKLESALPEDEMILGYNFSHDNNLYSSWSSTVSENSTIPQDIEIFINNLETDINQRKESIERLNNGQEVKRLENRDLHTSKVKEKRKNTIDNFIKALGLDDFIQPLKSEEFVQSYFEFLEGMKFYAELNRDAFNPQKKSLSNFVIFCLEFTELRTFSTENQIEPLGIKGQGLFKYLQYLSQPQFKEKLDEIKEKLELIDWFEDFDIPDNLYPGERTLKIKDRYLDPNLEYFDQKSANEGFLFLLFYFCLFIGEETPKFFAIDNIDSSLNPRLCRRLIEELVELAKKHDKQVILTTHNPAILDGLDLHDDDQKLYVIRRKLNGETRADRVPPLKPPKGKDPVRLSEAFLRGYIGGLPENF